MVRPSALALAPLLLLSALLSPSCAVDRNKFRTCSQSAFCGRARRQAQAGGESRYKVDTSSLQPTSTGAEAVLLNQDSGVQFRLEVQALQDRTFRLRVREAYPLQERFEPPEVLLEGAPQLAPAKVVDSSDAGFTLRNELGDKLVVQASPFRVDAYSDGVLVLSGNARGLFRFEHTRQKPGGGEQEQEQEQQEEEERPIEEEEEDLDDISEEDDDIRLKRDVDKEQPPPPPPAANEGDDEPGMWEESFGGNTDSKPSGPQAVAMDFAFVGTDHVYGIPEHADNFDLKDTTGTDPFRHYNLDVFEYELWNPMALYAAIPLMIGHNKDRTTGLFWLNTAETWIDVKKSGTGMLGSLANMVSSQSPRTDTHWISESGVIDVFILLGPKPKDVSRQYAALTGTTPLPPTFALAYHQCRWNYNDQDDVRTVADKFDENDLPMDVMWLDIEHTDGKKYFTWDGRKFSDSLGMIKNLTAVGRKLVTIVDPHIKKDSGYWVHTELKSLGLYVKNKEGHDYEGWCWPGASYYPDFLNPAARQYFADQYHLDKYQGTTLDVYTWNDMNEPSVFNGPEVTMPKDMVHIGGVEHRHVHNLYGHLYLMATHAGQLQRSGGKLRPFVLTRAAFAGSQRVAAIWTGDNTADWGHLEAAVPMCLSLSVAGMTFVGADVGGFFGNPDAELMVRWYQAASFQPFFR